MFDTEDDALHRVAEHIAACRCTLSAMNLKLRFGFLFTGMGVTTRLAMLLDHCVCSDDSVTQNPPSCCDPVCSLLAYCFNQLAICCFVYSVLICCVGASLTTYNANIMHQPCTSQTIPYLFCSFLLFDTCQCLWLSCFEQKFLSTNGLKSL